MNIRPFFYVLFSHLEDASQIKRERKIRKHRNLKFLTMTFLGIMKMSYIAFNNIRWGQISSLYFKISVIKMDSWAILDIFLILIFFQNYEFFKSYVRISRIVTFYFFFQYKNISRSYLNFSTFYGRLADLNSFLELLSVSFKKVGEKFQENNKVYYNKSYFDFLTLQ